MLRRADLGAQRPAGPCDRGGVELLITSDKGPQSANALDVLGEFWSSLQYTPTKVTKGLRAMGPWALPRCW